VASLAGRQQHGRRAETTDAGYDRAVTVRLALLGDSIAFGQGAARQEDRPANRLTRSLAELGIDVTAHVFAVRGVRSAGLRSQVDRAVAWQPDVAVLIIGANDLVHQVPPDQAAGDLGAAVRRLRDAGAEVVVAPAPDLSIVPFVPDSLRTLVRGRSKLLRIRQAKAVQDAGGRVADEDAATSVAFAADRSLFSGDAFHPSGAGYRAIVEALLPVVLAAADLPAAEP
jgi:lysophospholipase L1-like esterase